MLFINSHQVSKRKKGFTLIELLIGLLIFGLVLIMITGIITDIFKGETNAEAYEDLQRNSSLIIQDLIQEIRWSKSVDFEDVSGETFQNLLLTQEDGTTIRYRVNDDGYLEKDGELLISETTKIIAFDLYKRYYQDSSTDLPLIVIQFNLEDKGGRILYATDKTFALSMRRNSL